MEQILVEHIRVMFSSFESKINEKSWMFYFKPTQSSEAEFMRVVLDIIYFQNSKYKTHRINNTKNIKIKVICLDKSFRRTYFLLKVFRKYRTA